MMFRRVLNYLPARRPLQISEVRAAAGEHMMARALPGLRHRYLPTSLTVRVSPADLLALSPFIEELTVVVAAAHEDLSDSEAFVKLEKAFEFRLEEHPGLNEGDMPHFASGFPLPNCSASWPEEGSEAHSVDRAPAKPGGRAAEGSLPSADAAVSPILRLVFTCEVGGGTAAQSEVLLSFGAPRGFQEPRGESIERSAPEEIRTMVASIAGDGRGDPGRSACVTDGVEPHAGVETVYHAVENFLMVGRDRELVHLVPEPAPLALSGCHFALIAAEAGGIQICDLASTNGTRVDGSRIRAFEPVDLKFPACVEVGSEEALIVDMELIPS